MRLILYNNRLGGIIVRNVMRKRIHWLIKLTVLRPVRDNSPETKFLPYNNKYESKMT